jgi:hypothetical protein
VRVSRRTHQVLTTLAEQSNSSVSDLLDRLAERERRQSILRQYNSRMAQVLVDPQEREHWRQEIAISEAGAEETLSLSERAAAVAR